MPERRARVLIVDDAVVARSMVSRMLADDPELEVVGTSANGRLALRRLERRDVDVVVLDVDMPEMDGLATLRALKREQPEVRVIMFSSHTEAGATATVESLALGAYDYITKPSATGTADQTLAAVRDELLRKIKAAYFGVELGPSPSLRQAAQPQFPRPAANCTTDVVAIGASTGGPNALCRIFTELPADFPVPIVVVQHMPPLFTRIFAERLNGLSRLNVREATDGAPLEAGQVLLAPGGMHMVVARESRALVKLTQDPPVNYCRPSVDVLFNSVAAAYGPRALGLVLTGMGQDGLRGSEQIRTFGGRVLAQNEESSVVWGMPGYVVRANLAQEIVPLDGVSEALLRVVQQNRAAASAIERARASNESVN